MGMSKPCTGSRWTAKDQGAPEGTADAFALPQVLHCREHLVYRVGDQQHRDRRLREAESTQRTDAHGPQWHDEQSEQQHQPRHGTPAALIADDTGQNVEDVGDRSQSGVGNGKSLRHTRRDDGLGAVAPAAVAGEERIPEAVDVPELERTYIARDEQSSGGFGWTVSRPTTR
jgi:hypothetical protein